MTDQSAPIFFQLIIKVLEDLHTGTGTGQGDIDALVIRDRYGKPVIRASHFEGLLREAGDKLIWLEKIKKIELAALLGDEGGKQSSLCMTSLRTDENSKTLVWASSKRKPNSRVPEKDTLRFIEYVAAGACFKAILRIQNEAQQTLLERLLRRIDRIGGGRNRGSGLVQVDWQTCKADTLLEEFLQTKSDRAPRINPQVEHPAPTVTRLRLVLRNYEPLCLPVTGHPGNLIRSDSFIRGQRLRGALMAWALANAKEAQLEKISIGDALPLPAGFTQAHTVLPIPLSILTQKPKAKNTTLPWWAGGSEQFKASDSLSEAEEQTEGEKRKRPGMHEYLCKIDESSTWLRYTPTMNVRLRNKTPEGVETEAKLFSLEEIAEGTYFQAELCFDNAAAATKFINDFTPLLTGQDWFRVGRGGQPVGVASFTSIEETRQSESDFKDDWILTLSSDLIIRGDYLGFLYDLDVDTLCKLACEDNCKDKQDGWRIEKSIVETEVAHGFNAASGLHRVPALALRRGSCWQITGSGSAALARALAVKQAMGERTREGHGRFVIGVQPITTLEKPERLENQPLVNQQEKLLLSAKNLAKESGARKPSASQLQWLRNHALAVNNEKELDNLLKEISTAPERRPKSGKPWEKFPIDQLKDEFKKFSSLEEKRLLVSYLVQYLILEKESTDE